MLQLMVTGVGFSPGKIIEPARRLPADGILLVYGQNTRSEIATKDVLDAFPDKHIESVAVADWDLPAMAGVLRPAVQRSLDLLGGPRRCRPVVNLTAGHGLMHACLSHFANEQGLELVLWAEGRDALVRSSFHAMGVRPLPAKTGKVLRAFHRREHTAAQIAGDTGLPTSTVYNALAILQRMGLVHKVCHGRFSRSDVEQLSRSPDRTTDAPAGPSRGPRTWR